MPSADQNGGSFAQVRKDSVAHRDGLPVRPRAQLAGFAGSRGIRLITRSGRYRVASGDRPVRGRTASFRDTVQRAAHTADMPVRLHHIVVDAHDLPGLARFWTQALGWKVLSERENEIVIGTD